jgi:transcription elongation factor
MKPSFSDHNDFLAGKLLPGVRFHHNDYVRVVAGEHSVDSGSVVSVEELGADPLLLIELESNKDALIRQSALEVSRAQS